MPLRCGMISSTPKSNNLIYDDIITITIDGESVEAIINKLKLNASSIYDSSDEDDDFHDLKGSNNSSSNNNGVSNTSRSNNSNLSSSTQRQPPIVQKLLEEGKMMEERKEQLRNKHYSEVSVLFWNALFTKQSLTFFFHDAHVIPSSLLFRQFRLHSVLILVKNQEGLPAR